MNPSLSKVEVAALLEVLYRGLLEVRATAMSDPSRAEAIADALHNVPHLLAGTGQGWTTECVRAFFLEPLVERYPDLASLAMPLEELDLRGA